MTETLALVVDDRTVGLDDLAGFARSVGDVTVDGAVMTLRQGPDRCHVVKVSDPESDGIFEDWPAAGIPAGPSAIFSVDYRSPDLVVALVLAIARRRSLTVDTNHGRVVRGEDLAPDMLRPG